MRKALIIGLPLVIAIALVFAWIRLHSGDPVANARQRMARQDMRGAEFYLRQALGRQPDNAEAAFLLGKVDLATGNPQAAELELRRARAHGYNQAAIVLPLGQAYLQQQHFDAVLHDFDADHAPASERGDILTLRAAAQLSLGDTAAAASTAALAEAAAPDARETLLTAARIALARDDLGGADKRIAQILVHDPKQPDAVLIQCEIAMRRNKPEVALAGARAILTDSPGRLDARMMEARALAASNKLDGARASVAQVLRGAPNNLSANFLSAMLALQDSDYPTADAALTRIGPLVDQLPRGYYLLAMTKLGMGQPAQAEEAASKFLAKSPDDIAGLKLLAFVELSRRQPAAALHILQQGTLAAQPDADTLDLTGRAQAMAGDMRGASESFMKAVAKAPNNVGFLNRLAVAHLGLGDEDAAITDLHRSLQIAPKQRAAEETIVEASLARGDIAGAKQGVADLRRTMGDSEQAGVLSSQVRLAMLDLDGAETELHGVLRRFPDSRSATLGLVRVAGIRGDRATKETLLEGLLRRNPADVGALELLLPALFADQRSGRAVEIAEAAHTAAPDNQVVTAALASAYADANQTDRAVALLDRASVEVSPQLDGLRASLLVRQGKVEQAEQVFRAILRQAPSDLHARGDLARLLMRAKRYDDARAILRDGLQAAPGNPLLLGALVSVDLRDGGIKQALATAEALKADPKNLPAANALPGDAWLASGDPRRAAITYLAAQRATPSSELAAKAAGALNANGDANQAIALLTTWTASHPQDLQAQSLLSSIYITARRLPEADQHLNAILAVRQNDVGTLNNLAWVKQQQGDLAQARPLAERAYFQSPVPEVADTLGWILAQQGDTSRALPLLAQAVTDLNAARQAAARYHYGYTLNIAHRPDEARTQLQQAIATTAGFTERQDATQLLATLK